MPKLSEMPDYSLENALPDNHSGNEHLNIKTTVVLEVQPSDVYCVKGDCVGDSSCPPY